MAAPILGKCTAVVVILAVLLLYDGRAFKVRDFGQGEHSYGTCNANKGKCTATSTSHLYRRKLERVSVRGTFAKFQRPLVNVDEGGSDGEEAYVRTNVESVRPDVEAERKGESADEEEEEEEDAVVEDDVSVENVNKGDDKTFVESSIDVQIKYDDDKDSTDTSNGENSENDDNEDSDTDNGGDDDDEDGDDDDDDDDDDNDDDTEYGDEKENIKDNSDENRGNIVSEDEEEDSKDKNIIEVELKDDVNDDSAVDEEFDDKSKEDVKVESRKQDDDEISSDDNTDTSENVSKMKFNEENDDLECSEEDTKEHSNKESFETLVNNTKLEIKSESENSELKPEFENKIESRISTPMRKFEKVKYANKDKMRKVNSSFTKLKEASSVSDVKESPTARPTKLTDSTKYDEAVDSRSKIKDANDMSSSRLKPKNVTKSETTKITPKIVPQIIESKSTKQKLVSKPARTMIKPKVNEFRQVDTQRTTGKPKKRTDSPITLAELNDAILSVPTFVLNFTAVEDSACQQHGKIFLRQLRGFKLWALQMLDSTAKIPSGLLRGNVNQLGDFDQCLGISTRVKINEQVIKVQGKYCLATVDLHATRPHMKVAENLMQSRVLVRGSMNDPDHFVPRFTPINWAICLPAACSAEDAQRAMEDALQPYNSTIGMKFVVNVDPEMCYVKQKNQGLTKETIGVLYFYAIIICLVITASVRDCFVKDDGKGNYAERIIMSFSLQRNIRALLKDNVAFPEDVTCIHGIRSLSTVAIYIAHKLIPICRMPYANRVTLTEVTNYPLSIILRASWVYTDSFLLLSGTLTAYNMTKELSARGEIRWFCRFVTRYIRLTPSLVVILFWYTFMMEHVGSGPQWNNLIKSNADLCKKNAWTNLFYIQNFFPFEEMCAAHTHQLALDMQLFFTAPILVYFLHAKPVIGALLIFFILQVSATLRYFAVVNNNLSLVIYHGMTVKQLHRSANLLYILPLHRATAYLFGVILGVFLKYTGKNVCIHKVFIVLGWIISIALGSWSLLSPWRLARRDYIYNVEDAASYAVISPISSSLALCWVIFACFTNHGGFINKLLSNYWLVIFSRLSYAVYLTQFAVFFYNAASTRYSSEFKILGAFNLPEFVVVIFISTIITLFFDIPMQEVKNVIFECTHEVTEISDKMTDQMTVEKDVKTNVKEQEKNLFEDENCEDLTKIRLRRQGIKKFLTRSDTYDSEESKSFNRNYDDEDDNRDELYIRDRYLRLSRGDEYEIRRRERSSSRTSTRSNIEDYGRLSRMEYGDRPSSLDSEEGQSWEFVRRERSLSRNRDVRKTRFPSRLSVERFVDQGPSSGSEEDRIVNKEQKLDRKPAVVPRVSDEEDWDEDLRIRRESYVIEDEEMDSLRRRSSAEGKIALLQDPVDSGSMDFWTVSKVSQLGSSLEPSEPEDESYMKDNKEVAPSEEEGSWHNEKGEELLTSRSQITSADEDDVATYDFVLRKDSKRITVQDLSTLPLDTELAEKDDGTVPVAVAPFGLFKRESIIKSQASEEDPEYLLPERPKLQEQEQDHPFKKAWQEQKSRSEEDTSVYTIKDIKRTDSSKSDDDGAKGSVEPTGEKAIEDELNYNWQEKNIVIKEIQDSSNFEANGNSEILDRSSEEQFWSYKAKLHEKKEVDSCVLWEDDYQNENQ